MKDDCIFCKIVAGTIPAKILLDRTDCILIADRNPIAPHHVLVISREHFDDVGDAVDNAHVMADMLMTVEDYVVMHELNVNGYRLIINTGKDAGQTVKHLHMHLLAGATLKNDFGA